MIAKSMVKINGRIIFPVDSKSPRCAPGTSIDNLREEKTSSVSDLDDLLFILCTTVLADSVRHHEGTALRALNQIHCTHLPVRSATVSLTLRRFVLGTNRHVSTSLSKSTAHYYTQVKNRCQQKFRCTQSPAVPPGAPLNADKAGRKTGPPQRQPAGTSRQALSFL